MRAGRSLVCMEEHALTKAMSTCADVRKDMLALAVNVSQLV